RPLLIPRQFTVFAGVTQTAQVVFMLHPPENGAATCLGETRMNSRHSLRRAGMLLAFTLLAACGEEPQEQRGVDDYTARMAEQHATNTAEHSGARALGDGGALAVASETVDYGQEQGQVPRGYLAYPESAHGGLPGEIFFHPWRGLNG